MLLAVPLSMYNVFANNGQAGPWYVHVGFVV